MNMLYNYQGDTKIVPVEPLPSEEAGRYRPECKPFRAIGEAENCFVSGPGLLGIVFDENIILEGRCGCGVIISDDQVQVLRDAWLKVLANRKPLKPSGFGARCYSCGFPRSGRGECKHCGDDTRS